MLLTLLTYSYLRGVLSSRAIEDRCRYDVTFRVACGKHVPDHTTIARFRRRACAQDGLMEELFYAVLRVCAAAGLGRLTVIAGDGVKIGANASKEANRTEAGLRKLAATIMAQAAGAEEQDGRRETAGEDLFGGEALPGGWADPRSRLGRVRQCLADFAAQREAAEAARRAQGQAYLDGLAAGELVTRPPAAFRSRRRGSGWTRRWPPSRPRSMSGTVSGPPGAWRAASRSRWTGPAGWPGSGSGWNGPKPRLRRRRRRTGWSPAGPGKGRKAQAGPQRHRPGLGADAGPRRRAEAGLQLPGRDR